MVRIIRCLPPKYPKLAWIQYKIAKSEYLASSTIFSRRTKNISIARRMAMLRALRKLDRNQPRSLTEWKQSPTPNSERFWGIVNMNNTFFYVCSIFHAFHCAQDKWGESLHPAQSINGSDLPWRTLLARPRGVGCMHHQHHGNPQKADWKFIYISPWRRKYFLIKTVRSTCGNAYPERPGMSSFWSKKNEWVDLNKYTRHK